MAPARQDNVRPIATSRIVHDLIGKALLPRRERVLVAAAAIDARAIMLPELILVGGGMAGCLSFLPRNCEWELPFQMSGGKICILYALLLPLCNHREYTGICTTRYGKVGFLPHKKGT